MIRPQTYCPNRLLLHLSVLVTATLVPALLFAEGLIQNQVEAFKNSEIIFQKSHSNVPFAPLAFMEVSSYGDAKVDTSSRGVNLEYDVDMVSQGAAMPFLINERSAILVGEYLSYARFNVHNTGAAQQNPDIVDDRFSVSSVGLPLGWMYQNNEKWQTMAFVMPMTHKSTLPDADRSWQYLMGAFARYISNEDLWWIYGVYADLSEGDDFVVPYVGAYWAVNEHWSLSAIMPWPSVTYASSPDWFVRFGVSPSSASWSIDPAEGAAAVNYDAWDFGLTYERRLWNRVWMHIEGGVGGFRGIRIENDQMEDSDITVSTSPYISIGVNYRPSLN